MHEVVKGKFFAFKGPTDGKMPYMTKRPSDYFDVFKHKNVKAVVRLNKKEYNREPLVRAGFEHHDLFFVDCSTPSDAIVDKFLRISEKTEGALAVHCLAGLGRTGTLIGMYMMKHMGFTANECMAWLRIVRPGSVIGPQQQYLKSQEQRMWVLGNKNVSGLGLDGARNSREDVGTGCDAEVSQALAEQITKGMQLRDKFRHGSQGQATDNWRGARGARGSPSSSPPSPPTLLPPVEKGRHTPTTPPAYSSGHKARDASGGAPPQVRTHLASHDSSSASHVAPSRVVRDALAGGGGSGVPPSPGKSNRLQQPARIDYQPTNSHKSPPATPTALTPTSVRQIPVRQVSARRRSMRRLG